MAPLLMWLCVSGEGLVRPDKKSGAAGAEKILPWQVSDRRRTGAMLTTLLYSLLALDQTLAELAAQHSWVLFVALFLVIFAETGLVVFPLLPGDSLLFLAGTVAAASGIDVHLLAFFPFLAAGAGDSVNRFMRHFPRPDALYPAPGRSPAGDVIEVS